MKAKLVYGENISQAAQFVRQNPKGAAEIDTRYLDGLNVADAIEGLTWRGEAVPQAWATISFAH